MEAASANERKLHSPQPKRLQVTIGGNASRRLFQAAEEVPETPDLVLEEVAKILGWRGEKYTEAEAQSTWRCAFPPEREFGNPLEDDEFFVAVGKMDGILPWDFRISTP